MTNPRELGGTYADLGKGRMRAAAEATAEAAAEAGAAEAAAAEVAAGGADGRRDPAGQRTPMTSTTKDPRTYCRAMRMLSVTTSPLSMKPVRKLITTSAMKKPEEA